MLPLLLTALLAAPSGQVHTSTADVRACAFVRGGETVVAATGGGLLVVDAQAERARHLTALDGLPGTGVDAVLAIDADEVWVGTERGLARVRVGDTGVRVEAAIESASVRALAREGETIWVGTWGDGVQRLVGERLQPVPLLGGVPSAAHVRITDLRRYDRGWVAATAGAGLLRGDVRGFSPWSTALDGEVVWSLAVHEDRLVAGTLRGVFLDDEGFRRIDDIDARDVAVHDGGELEVATMGQGLRHYGADGRPTAARESIAVEPMVQGVARHGELRCVATTAGLRLDNGPGTRSQQAPLGDLPSRDVSALAHDPHEGRVWVGTFDRGLAMRDATGWHTITSPELDPQVNALAVQRIGERSIVWVGTARGLSRVDGTRVQTWTTKAGLPHDHVQSVLVRRDGSVAVGTTLGLVEVRGDEIVALDRRRRPKRWAVWAIAEDDDETLWLGTTHGLVAWPKEGRWTSYSMLKGTLPDDWITAVAVDGDAIWVGTYAQGVARLGRDEHGAWVRQAWLGGGRINPGGLTLQGSELVASTMSGLRRRPRHDDGAAWQDEPRAATGRDVTAVMLVGATRWVASRRGLVEGR